jgi:hypothetical protein
MGEVDVIKARAVDPDPQLEMVPSKHGSRTGIICCRLFVTQLISMNWLGSKISGGIPHEGLPGVKCKRIRVGSSGMALPGSEMLFEWSRARNGDMPSQTG